MDEERFYIVDIDHDFYPVYKHLPDWFGLVDEEQGGVIAFFEFEEHAEHMLSVMLQSQSTVPPVADSVP